ncbi:disease resistance protein (TIR-NBS-LRR class) family [Artemisia annua]|uniref:Disease resistance protein (TIR-NBS-LRR class) family n=1 Tax=Artemisia annua TaxID=35608 RepID=A0A2U1MPJ7_ARTAN|nr:disease resistance protein (TIR-NBS-LRR class) family [Artemisia annua]
MSTSTSSIQNSFKYDVFISFRGEDTRKNFVDHLYQALMDKGIYTYKDDTKIQKGEWISDELIKAIEDSKFYIIIFSKNYASSSWCLEELVKIMECQKMDEHTAYPVFYDVEPTEIRKQSGAVGEAFVKHENEEAAGTWREALTEAADLPGWEMKNTNDGHEAKFIIKKIVEEMSFELRFINSGVSEKLLPGMKTRVKDVVSSLEDGIDEVRMIGIKGMGGAGKTTLAIAVFDHLSADFEAKSFVENVREVSTTLGLKKLQKQVLSEVLHEHVTLNSVDDGKNMLKRRMFGKKVLLVLDDVDHIEQLKALAGEPKWFRPGSIIVITTRDQQVLVAHRVSLIHNVTLLSQTEAGCLLSRYAFKRDNPIQGYEELSGKVLQYADGLPLTIKVMGSSLHGLNKNEWENAIERLKKIPLEKTQKKLELSYVSLEDEYKEIFLDIAFLLIGGSKKDAIRFLERCGFHARNGLKVLEQRSLITISEGEEYLGMHRHIEEMGKNIVRRSHPNEPNKYSRLWIYEAIEDILDNDKHNSNKLLCFSDPSFITPAASTSSSSIQKRFKYDVFISFRGEDTRKTFVGHLYQALKQTGIETFKDDEKMKQGETIDNQLIQAIKDSRFFIIVFSQNYASSSWCLDELVEIMECQKTGEQTAYPVFFDVEPTQVRKQSGAFGKAFLENKNKDAARKWIEALKGASNLVGRELQATANGHEAEFIKKIVGEISLELRSNNFNFDENLVGMETRVKDVVSSLEVGIDEVHMIGIKGMGGAGKTTTARAIFDHLSADFEAKSFVENVREVSNGSALGLKNLQEQVLSNVLNEHVTLDSVTDGKNMMKKRMCGKKVLLVLDDVDHIDQLKALAGEPMWFKPGSIILITTRDEQVLIAHRVNVIRDIVLLSEQEAISLFSRYAFGRENPLEGYEELSGKVVHYAAGLPLTLEVLGSFLCGKDMDYWEDAIKRLKDIPLKETLKKLELSYTSLEDDDYKEIFLYIACILKGKRKTDAITILESCGFHARTGLKVLEQRSLITISGDEERLGMHDHIEEMGKDIARRLHPNSRLWNVEIEDICANDMGIEETRCLKMKMKLLRGNSRIHVEGLGKMKKLGYLQLYFVDNGYESDWERVLKKLKFLSFYESYLTTFEFRITPNLETLSLGHSYNLEELCVPVNCQELKHLNISHSKLRTFDLGLTPNLETLSLETSRNLEELCVPVNCQKLKHLNISHSKLRTFDLGLTPNLETLSLETSRNLEELCVPVNCQKLKHLNVSHSKLRTFDLGLTLNLEKLSLVNCTDLEELHVSVACPNLKFLDLSRSRLRSLDLELIPNLERLDLANCDELVETNAPVGCLKKVVHLNLRGCLRFSDFVFHSKWETKVNCSSTTLHLAGEFLDLCPLHPNSNLPKLGFRGYYEEYLPSSVGNIEKLISFGLCACTDLKKLSDIICSLQCLEKLTLECNIPVFPKDLGKLECLEELCLYSTKIKHLPDSICMLKRLKSLKVNYSDLLEKLPEDLGRLECLEMLYVTSEKIEYLPDSICMLKRLKSLDVPNCCRLGKLPEDIGKVEFLEKLDLSASMIKHLPDSICMLKHLKYLKLDHCALLEKLPEDLGQLECLEKLYIRDTGISHLPQSIFGLIGLLIIASSELLQLYEDFPLEIETISYWSRWLPDRSWMLLGQQIQR